MTPHPPTPPQDAPRPQPEVWLARRLLVLLTAVAVGLVPVLQAPLPAAALAKKSELLSAPVPRMCGHPAGRLISGRLPGIPAQQGHVTLAENRLIALGRIKGRGTGAAATVRCSQGGVSWPDHLVFYDPKKRTIGHADLYRHTRGGREHVRKVWIRNRVVHVQVAGIAQSGDAACCGSKSAKLTFRWAKTQGLARTSRIFYTERKAVRSLLSAVRRGDRAQAQRHASPAVVEHLIVRNTTHRLSLQRCVGQLTYPYGSWLEQALGDAPRGCEISQISRTGPYESIELLRMYPRTWKSWRAQSYIGIAG